MNALAAPSLPAVPVFYTTSDGQTRRIAERLAHHVRGRGLTSEAIDLRRHRDEPAAWAAVRGAALCAPLRYGRHSRLARQFAHEHRDRLAAVPSLFVSVCLAVHSQNPDEREAADRLALSFAERSGWTPDRTEAVAGRLAYTRYGVLVRWVMRRIAKKEGGSTDTSRDHEYTDWKQVERLAGELASRVA